MSGCHMNSCMLPFAGLNKAGVQSGTTCVHIRVQHKANVWGHERQLLLDKFITGK